MNTKRAACLKVFLSYVDPNCSFSIVFNSESLSGYLAEKINKTHLEGIVASISSSFIMFYLILF